MLSLFSAQLALQQVKPFHGRPGSNPADFLDQLRFAFQQSSLGLGPEENKVRCAISCLRDKAREWIQPFRQMSPPPAWLSDFDLFAAELTNRFGNPHRSRNPSARLRSLKQTGSVADYATEFRQCAAALNWADPPLIDIFYDGLKGEVKRELIRAPYPTDLESCIQQAIDADTCLQELYMEQPRASRPANQHPKKPRPHPQGHAAPSTPTPSRDSPPVAARHPDTRPQQRSTTRPRTRKLTEEEKEHRRQNDLCIYCGSSEHIIRDCPSCPTSRPRPALASQATVPAADPQGNSLAQLQ
jgi:hypothetical protein